MRSWMRFGLVCLVLASTAAEARKPRRAFTVQEDAPTDATYAAERIARRAEAIDRLIGITDTQLGDRAPEVRLRLGELFDQNGRDARLIEDAAFREVFDRCFDDPDCTADDLEPDRTRSNAWFAKAVRSWSAIVSGWPTYGRMDETLWFIASAQQALDRPDDALQTRLQLVKRFPESDFAADGFLLIGEHHYDRGNLVKAIAAYRRAAADLDYDRWDYATYMLAWCFYAGGETDPAIAAMLDVARGGGDFEEDAWGDLVRFYADAGKSDEGYRALNKYRPGLVGRFTVRLAELAVERGDWDQAFTFYRRVQLMDPLAPEASETGAALLDVVHERGPARGELEELTIYARAFGPKSGWAEANPDRAAEAWATHEQHLRRLAIDQHERSRKHRRDLEIAQVAADLADRAYARWMADHSDSDQRVEVQYAWAELHYEQERWVLAYDHYTEVLALDPTGPRAEACAEGAVFAAKELDDTPRFVAAVDRYAQHFPATEKTRGMGYEAGYRLYEAKRYADAADRFERVIALDPGSKEAALAAELILDVLVIAEDWEQLAQRAAFFGEHPMLGDARFRQDVADVERRATFKLIELDLKRTGDEGVAGAAFRRWASEHADVDLAVTAQNNAAVYLGRAGRFDEALAVRLELVEDERLTEAQRFEHTAAIGDAYEQIADYAHAAEWFERLASLPGDASDRADALHRAAVFRDAMGQFEASIADYRAFLDEWPDDERAPDMHLSIGRIEASAGEHERAAETYRAFAEATDDDAYRIYALLHRARALEAAGEIGEAMAGYAKTSEAYRAYLDGGGSPGVHTTFAAESLMKLADERFETYDAIALVGIEASMSRQQQSDFLTRLTQEKAKTLGELREAYAQVIETGDGEWGIAALVRIGQAHEDMADTLAQSDRPTFLTPEQLDLYNQRIGDQIFNQHSQSKDAYHSALEKAAELNLSTEFTQLASARLAALDPNAPPMLPERTGRPLVDLRVPTDGYETSLE